jgi:hypothetical protein
MGGREGMNTGRGRVADNVVGQEYRQWAREGRHGN